MLLRELGLQSAPAAAVTGDDNFPFDIDAATGEVLVVIRHTVVEIDEISGDIAIAAVDVVSGHGVRPRRALISRDRRLLQAGDKLRGGHQFQRVLLEGGIENLERLNLRVPAPLLEQIPHRLGVRLIVGRADVVRLG